MAGMRRRLTLEHVAMVALVLAGVAATAGPISDNSTFVHLRTGIGIFESGRVPGADPYSFTAAGENWVVQSWFPAWTYGALYELGGALFVILEQMLLAGAIALAMVLLARSGSMVRTTAAAGLPIAMSFFEWSQRPLLFGLLAFALLMLVVEKRQRWWLLVPLAWIWVNSHGSFPIAFVWLGAVLAGEWLDTRRLDRDVIRYGGAFLGGVLFAAVGPVGLELLTFWSRAFGERGDVFGSIIEWASPNFRTGGGALLLAALVGSLALLMSGRISWRRGLPVLIFLAASLYSARYVGPLAIVLCPALAERLRGGAQRETEPASPVITSAALVVVLLAGAGMVARVVADDHFSLKDYPEAALDRMTADGTLRPEDRLLAQDFVGCYIIFRDEGRRKVFIDDRYDMYPVEVSKDYTGLVNGKADVRGVLDEYRIDVALWQKNQPLPQILGNSTGWTAVYEDEDWKAFRRAP